MATTSLPEDVWLYAVHVQERAVRPERERPRVREPSGELVRGVVVEIQRALVRRQVAERVVRPVREGRAGELHVGHVRVDVETRDGDLWVVGEVLAARQ